jgi:hypothetical protein
MLYYWQADFESGNAADYFDVWYGGFVAPGRNSNLCYNISDFIFSRILDKYIASTSELYAQFWFRCTSITSVGIGHGGIAPIMRFEGAALPLNGGATIGASNSGQLAIFTGWFGSFVQLGITPGQVIYPGASWHKIDVYLKLDDVNGRFRADLNDVTLLDFTGDTIEPGGLGTVGRISLQCFWPDNFVYDTIAVSDSPIRPPMFISYM